MGAPAMADLDAAVARIAGIGEYQSAFQGVFGRAPTAQDLQRAIASYERTLLSFDSPFDRFMAGEKTAISDQQAVRSQGGSRAGSTARAFPDLAASARHGTRIRTEAAQGQGAAT
jgi:hypothetical protein